MTRKRVIVVESEKLLSAGVYSLLSVNGHLEVEGVILEEQNFLDAVKRFQPDVVIMDESILAQHIQGYMTFLKEFPRMRTIVLNLGTNSVQVCDQQLIHVEHFDDFLGQI